MKKYIILLLFLFNISMKSWGQSPGGVGTDLQLWYKADAGITTSGTTVTGWNNQSTLNPGSYNLAMQTGQATTTLPIINNSSRLVNFNPTVGFDGVNDRMTTNSTVPFATIVTGSNPYNTTQYIVYNLRGAANALYSNSNGSGGVWNIGSTTVDMAITNRGVSLPAPTIGIPRIQGLLGTSNAASTFRNGLVASSTFSGATQTVAAQQFWLGSQGTSSFTAADIAEVIIYNQNKNTGTNRNQIESYLAIKYGITLGTTASPVNYISSAGTVIWTANATYQNNIAGIGRDDGSGLHQRQSQSQNAGVQPIIGNNSTILATNIAGAGDIGSSGNFMIWGSDAGTDKMETSFIFGTINARMNRIWKVQETGTIGTVKVALRKTDINGANPQLIISNDAVFNGSDTQIAMVEETIGGVIYYTANVDMSSGQFFTFGSFVESPGGVLAGLRAWYKANAHTSQPSGSIWPDQSGNGKDLTSGGSLPTWNSVSSSYNFNPYFNFTAANGSYFYSTARIMDTSASPGTIFNVVKSNSTTTSYKVVSGFGNDNPQINQDGILGYDLWRQNANRVNDFGTDASTIPTHSINMFWNQSGGSQLQFNGFNSTINNTADGNITNNLFAVGSEGFNVPGVGSTLYNGGIPEVIVYNQNLNATDQSKINSYLSIKYGYTLRQGNLTTGTYNYISSSGSTVWAGAANSTYHNNVAGIARDNASGLHQKQSMSINSGGQVLISTTGVANTNQANTVGLISDGQYLVWGDNNLLKRLSIPLAKNLPSGNVTHRFEAIWSVQNTGNVDTVRVMWPAKITNLHLIQSSDANFNASDVFSSMSTTQTINGVLYAYTDVILSNGSFFTFGGFATGPGGVLNPIVWVKAEMGTNTTVNSASVNSWINNGIGDGVFTTLGTTTNPIYTNNKINFNPTVGYNSVCAGCGLKNVGVNVAGGGLANPLTSYAVSIRDGWPYSYVPTITFPNIYNGANNNYASLASVSSTQWQLYADGPSANTVTFPTQLVNTPYITSLNFPAVGQAVYSTNNGILKNSGSNVTSGYYVGKDANLFAEGRAAGSGAGYHSSYGHMSEVISYTKTLTAVERSQVESYLAIKSGVTLLNTAGTATTNYIASDGTTKVWDAAINSLYNFNIAGIARDDISTLDQRVSTTSNTTVTMGKLIASTINNFSLSNQDASRVKFDSNFQYVIIGDNNSTSTTLTDVNPVNCPALSNGLKQIAKKWFVQETGSVNSIFLEIDLNAYGISSDIQLLVGDNEPITLNSYIVSALSVSSSKAVFKVDFKNNSRQYFTVVGKVGAPACQVCRGGKYIIRQGNSWNTAAKMLNDSTGWFTYATDGEGTNLQARTNVSYTTASNEWVDVWYPSPYGSSALMAHVGTTNGAASLRTYKTVLNRAGKVNFTMAGISEWYGNKVKVVVKGYCGAGQVNPIITPMTNSVWNGYTISGNTVTGNVYYRGLDVYSQVNVSFNKPVERVEVEYTVERNPVRSTHFWFTLGDMSVECESPIEPNKNNVYIKQSFENDSIAACNEAALKLNIMNKNCNSRVLSMIKNDLPSGLEYVPNSYSGPGTPSYSGQSFLLENLTLLSGDTNLFVKVRSTDPNAIVSSTSYYTQSKYVVTVASGGVGDTVLSDNLSALSGLQATRLTFTPKIPTVMPELEFTSDNGQDACDTIGYTITIANNTGATRTGLQLQPFLNLGQIINGSVTLSSGLIGTVIPSPQNNETTFFIPSLSVPVGTHTITFSTVATKIDEFAKNYVELYYDPTSNECALAGKKVANLNRKCPTCEDGKGLFKMNSAWNTGGATARNSNQISNVTIGNPSSGVIKAEAIATYPLSGGLTIEWVPASFPRLNGKWTELSRYDNLNGAAGKVYYEVKLKDNTGTLIAARPSFQIAGMTNISKQEDVVSIRGYCGLDEFKPKLRYAYNSTAANNAYYRRFVIDSSNASAKGTQPYYDATDWATMNVEFEKPIDRFVVEWSVNRTPVTKTQSFLYIGNIDYVCDNKPEPNPDDVFIYSSVVGADTLPYCQEATIKLNIKNWNCDPRTINITNTLPVGIQFVDSSYSGLGSETPTMSGQNFSLSNLTIPSGNSYMYMKVKSVNNTTASYSTNFKFTVVGGTNIPNPYQSDDNSGVAGFQDMVINYESTPIIQKPTLVLKTDKQCYEKGDTILYTMTFENTSSSSLTNVEIIETMDNVMYLGRVNATTFGGTVTREDSLGFYISNAVIPVGKDSIVYKALAFDTVKYIENIFEVSIDPESPCGNVNRTASNLHRMDTAFYNPGLTTGTPKNTNVGITTMSKHQQAGWPWNVPNGWIALHSKSKGFVITRTTPGTITAPVEGMIIYDTIAKCIKLYNGTTWTCIQRQCKP